MLKKIKKKRERFKKEIKAARKKKKVLKIKDIFLSGTYF